MVYGRMCTCTYLFGHVCVCVCVCICYTTLGPHRHRNTQVRRAASQFLCLAVEHAGPDQLVHASKDILERTLVATLQFIGDAAAEPRWVGLRGTHTPNCCTL